jgi:hypothetical protein
MSNDRHAKYGAATGIVAVILIAVGFGVLTPKPPHLDAPPADFVGYFSDHQSAVRAGVVVASIGMLFFIWFLGSLRSGLAAAEGGSGRLANVAFGAGVVTAGFLLVGVAFQATAAFRPGQIPATETRLLSDLFAVGAAPAFAALTALFAATSLVAFRSTLPSWVGALTGFGAVAQPFAIGAALTQTGAFAGDGALGLFLPILGFIVGVLAISIALVRDPFPSPTAAPAPQ